MSTITLFFKHEISHNSLEYQSKLDSAFESEEFGIFVNLE